MTGLIINRLWFIQLNIIARYFMALNRVSKTGVDVSFDNLLNGKDIISIKDTVQGSKPIRSSYRMFPDKPQRNCCLLFEY